MNKMFLQRMKEQGREQCSCGQWLKRDHTTHCRRCEAGIVGDAPYSIHVRSHIIFDYCSGICQQLDKKTLQEYDLID